jgi:hypothetical protein
LTAKSFQAVFAYRRVAFDKVYFRAACREKQFGGTLKAAKDTVGTVFKRSLTKALSVEE